MFELSRDLVVDMSGDFLGGAPSSKVTTLINVGYIGLVKVEM